MIQGIICLLGEYLPHPLPGMPIHGSYRLTGQIQPTRNTISLLQSQHPYSLLKTRQQFFNLLKLELLLR